MTAEVSFLVSPRLQKLMALVMTRVELGDLLINA